MNEWFASGRVADLVLVLMIAEGLVLAIWHLRTGKGIAPVDLFWRLAAGAGLALALRSVLAGAAWPWTAAALLFSLVAHLTDLHRDWRRREDSPKQYRQ